MKKKLTNNLGLKIMAVLVSFALWLVVVNYDDPVVSYTYSGIQVEIINTDVLANQGKVYEVLSNTDMISVTVTGKRSVIDSISKENISAIADMQDLTLKNTLNIQLSTNKNFNQLDSIKCDQDVVELVIENLKESHMPISVSVTGEPAEDYIVGDITTNQNTVRVSGPESIVSTVARAECVISVAGRTSDINASADIKLYDAEGNLVEHPNLRTNISNISINVAILATKAVNITYNYSGVPEDGYLVDEPLVADRTAVYIAGKQSTLDTISLLVIPATAIDVDGKSQSYIASVDLNEYLPDGICLADATYNGKVAVSVNIVEEISRTINVPMNNLTVTNIPEGYTAEILLDSDTVETENGAEHPVLMNVDTVGTQEAYHGVTGATTLGTVDVAAYMESVDMTALPPGIYQMEITFALPVGVTTTQSYYADVKIEESE